MSDADRDHLRRIAYGPDATAQERVAAEESLRALDEEQLAAAADALAESAAEKAHPSALEGEAVEGVDGDDGDLSDDDSEEGETAPAFWQRSIRVAWLVPIVVGAIVVGCLGSLGPMAAQQRADDLLNPAVSAPPVSVPNIGEPILLLGDLQAADKWFDDAPASEKAFPVPEMLDKEGIRLKDVRLAIDGGENASIWVARTEKGLCLVFARAPDVGSAWSCIDRDNFEKTGLVIGLDGVQASWFGREVITNPPLVDPAAREPFLEGRPGNVDAANAFLGSGVTLTQNVFSETELGGMGVDLVGAHIIAPEVAPWISLMIAKQRAGGFCLVLADGDTLAKCSTLEEFQSRGLSLAIAGYVFQWDGNSLTSNKLP